MIKYDIEHDYVETATGLEGLDKEGDMRMWSDHEESPHFFFSHPKRGGWKWIEDEEFVGYVAYGRCDACDRRALLRVPKHLAFAVRLLMGAA